MRNLASLLSRVLAQFDGDPDDGLKEDVEAALAALVGAAPLNWTVALVVCPVCDEPVVADMPLETNNLAPPALIRHHVERTAVAGHPPNLVYCSGSKLQIQPCVVVDSERLFRQEPTAPDGRPLTRRVHVELQRPAKGGSRPVAVVTHRK